MSEETQQTGLSESAASGVAYLTFIPGIVFLVTPPFNQNPNIRFHAWQSIFLTIAGFCVCIVNLILAVIPIIGWLMAVALVLGLFIVWLICIVKAFGGGRFVVPVIGQLAAKQAGA